MGRSFVLRDASGTPAGYLTQGFDALRCSVRGVSEGAKAIVFYADGSIAEHLMDSSGTEQAWQGARGEPAGAVIVCEGRILADSGAEARGRYEVMLLAERRKEQKTGRNEETAPHRQENKPERVEEIKKEEKPKNSDQATMPELTRQEEQTRSVKGRGSLSVPERRWPPPPCMKEAVYRGGAWTQA